MTTRLIARMSEINCPGVLALQLPGNTDAFSSFLNHIWAFDSASSTREDRDRTRMYQESAQRQQYREQSFSLKDFIKGLQLRIEIGETDDEINSIVSRS